MLSPLSLFLFHAGSLLNIMQLAQAHLVHHPAWQWASNPSLGWAAPARFCLRMATTMRSVRAPGPLNESALSVPQLVVPHVLLPHVLLPHSVGP